MFSLPIQSLTVQFLKSFETFSAFERFNPRYSNGDDSQKVWKAEVKASLDFTVVFDFLCGGGLRLPSAPLEDAPFVLLESAAHLAAPNL